MRAAKVLVSAVAVLVVVSGCGAASGGGGSSSASSSASASDNGVAALPASEILAKATAAALAQKSVHATGSGKASSSQSLSIDLTLVKDGGGKGVLKLGTGTVEILASGDSVYLRGDKAFWESSGTPALATLVGEKWLKAPAGSGTFKDLASMASFADSLGSLLKPSGTPTKGEQKTIDGTPAIGLVDGKSTLWVATVGEPLPLKVEGSGKGDATFEWGVDATIAPPPAADTIDLSQLGG